jgi:peptide/nickel transport system ATP-binding protein
MSENLLDIKNLQITFNTSSDEKDLIKAVSGINLQIPEGKTIGLVGESGSGKSVTALAAMGLLPKDNCEINGEINYLGTNLLKLSNSELSIIRGKEISMVFQEPMTSLNPVLNIEKQIEEILEKHLSLTKNQIKDKTISLLKMVRISDPESRIKNYPHQFSGGQRQRIMIAMALACNPKLLIADEATTALDVTIQLQILELIKDLTNSMGTTLLMITHNLGIIARYAHQVNVMKEGKIVERGTALKIYSSPNHSYTKNLLKSVPIIDLKNKNKINKNITNINETPVISVKNLNVEFQLRNNYFFSKSTKTINAVRDVSFDIFRGETFGLVGESGSGKTTIGKSIVNLVEPKSGTIVLNGKKHKKTFQNIKIIRKNVGMVFQDPYGSLNPRMRIREIILEPIRVHYPDSDNENNLVVSLLQKVGLHSSMMYRYPHEFSGGQRQRICIARSLAHNPSLLILDEPLSALDVSIQAQIVELLKKLQRESGISYLFISHDLATVQKLSHKVAVMYLGKLIEYGSKELIYSNPLHPYTQALLDSVPIPDPSIETKINRTIIQGEIPSATNPPSGCVFRTRCPNPTNDCKEGNTEMALIEIEPEHWVDQCCVNCK